MLEADYKNLESEYMEPGVRILKVFKQQIHMIRAVLHAVAMGKVDWNEQNLKAERLALDRDNFPSRWKGGD